MTITSQMLSLLYTTSHSKRRAVALLRKRGVALLRHLLEDGRRVLPTTVLGQLYFVVLFTPNLLKFVVKMEILLSKVRDFFSFFLILPFLSPELGANSCFNRNVYL
jgi:hypothetical protein